ncbi:MAG: NifU family protein [Firmicutes bacterium]|nr:NifU family protein [Bacillota bacterium]
MERLKEKIQEILDEKINVQLALHNGSAELTGITEDGVAKVKFLGACASCMASADTFESVVRAAIMENVEGVTDVVIDNTVSQDLIDMARRILNKEI